MIKKSRKKAKTNKIEGDGSWHYFKSVEKYRARTKGKRIVNNLKGFDDIQDSAIHFQWE